MQKDVRASEHHSNDSFLIRTFEADPPGKLLLLHGRTPEVFRLSLHAASHALLRGVPIALVDGSNRFDVYYLAEFARTVTSQRLVEKPVSPEQLLRCIYVARAFTCYQMEATITDRLPAFLKKKHATIAIIFGLLDTFYDEQAPVFQVNASLQRIIVALRQLKERNISVLLASLDTKVESKERNKLFQKLAAAMDNSIQLTEGEVTRRIYEPQRRRDAEDE